MSEMIQKLQFWDEKFTCSVISKRGLKLTRFMKAISMVGDGYLYVLLAVLLYVVGDVSTLWLSISVFAFAIELLLYKIIKSLTSRRRPYQRNPSIENLVIPPDQFSFPSGHTAAATVAAIIFSVAIPMLTPILILIAGLIGFSRIYLGVHYLTDVLVGFALGVVSFYLSVLVTPLIF